MWTICIALSRAAGTFFSLSAILNGGEGRGEVALIKIPDDEKLGARIPSFFMVVSCCLRPFRKVILLLHVIFFVVVCYFLLAAPGGQPFHEVRLPMEYVKDHRRAPFWPPAFASSAGRQRTKRLLDTLVYGRVQLIIQSDVRF